MVLLLTKLVQDVTKIKYWALTEKRMMWLVPSVLR